MFNKFKKNIRKKAIKRMILSDIADAKKELATGEAEEIMIETLNEVRPQLHAFIDAVYNERYIKLIATTTLVVLDAITPEVVDAGMQIAAGFAECIEEYVNIVEEAMSDCSGNVSDTED